MDYVIVIGTVQNYILGAIVDKLGAFEVYPK